VTPAERLRALTERYQRLIQSNPDLETGDADCDRLLSIEEAALWLVQGRVDVDVFTTLVVNQWERCVDELARDAR
jgi:hypothetical protein